MTNTRGKECLTGIFSADRDPSVDSVTFDNQYNYINHKRLRQINDTSNSEYDFKLFNGDTSDLPELNSSGNVPLIFSCKQRRLSKLNFKKGSMNTHNLSDIQEEPEALIQHFLLEKQ